MRTIATVLASLVLAAPALADVTVTDGDTLVVNGSRIRLHGIDSPETHQSCADGWPAGAMATQELRGLVRGHAVTCEPKTTDRFGRTVAVCRADGVDLGAAMVRAGLAVAFTKFSQDYGPRQANEGANETPRRMGSGPGRLRLAPRGLAFVRQTGVGSTTLAPVPSHRPLDDNSQ